MKNIRIIFLISMFITVVSIVVVMFMALAESTLIFGEASLPELLRDDKTQVVFIMPVVLVIVAVAMIPFYRIFFPVKIKNGVQTKAKVLEVRDTGVTINDDPQVGLKLQFHTQEGVYVEAEAKTLVSRLIVSNVRPGILANVIYDPLKPERVLVESLETDEQPTPDYETGDEQPPSTAERLLELSDLRARGLVTDEEYQAKRAEILKNL